jgi:hypothetical protein
MDASPTHFLGNPELFRVFISQREVRNIQMADGPFRGIVPDMWRVNPTSKKGELIPKPTSA